MLLDSVRHLLGLLAGTADEEKGAPEPQPPPETSPSGWMKPSPISRSSESGA